MCRTVACNKNLKIELLGKMENFLNLSAIKLDHGYSNSAENQQIKSQLWNGITSDGLMDLEQVI